MLENGASTMVSWLATYLGHSTVLIGSVWAFCRYLPIDALTRSTLWKISLVGGLFTATLQTGLGYEPLLGNMAFETGVEAPAVPAPPPEVAPAVLDEGHACVGCDGPLVVVESDDVTAVITPGFVVIDGADGSLVVSREGGFVVVDGGREFAIDAEQPPQWGEFDGAMVARFEPPAPAFDRMMLASLMGPPALPRLDAVTAPAPASVGVASEAEEERPAPERSALPLVFAGLFLAGAGLSLARLGGTGVRLRRALRGRRVVDSGPLRERFARLLARARVREGQVRLTMSPGLGSPLALAGGEIVVPERAATLGPRQQEAMLAHELGHVLRRDPAWQVLASVIEAVLWFQPLNRLARRGIQEAAEELCDDWAVRHTGSGVHLARCLAEVAQWHGEEERSERFASPMAGSDGSLLLRRVRRLLDEHERERGRGARRWRGLLSAGLLLSVGLGAPGISLATAQARELEVPAAREVAPGMMVPAPPVAPMVPPVPPLSTRGGVWVPPVAPGAGIPAVAPGAMISPVPPVAAVAPGAANLAVAPGAMISPVPVARGAGIPPVPPAPPLLAMAGASRAMPPAPPVPPTPGVAPVPPTPPTPPTPPVPPTPGVAPVPPVPPTPPVFVRTADGGVRIVVDTQPERLTAKQRRMLRRAARLERRAEKLRHKSGGVNEVVIRGGARDPVIRVAPGAAIDTAKLRALAEQLGGLDEEELEELEELEGLDERIALEVEDELREMQAELERMGPEIEREVARALREAEDEVRRAVPSAEELREMEEEARQAADEVRRGMPSAEELRQIKEEARRAADAARKNMPSAEEIRRIKEEALRNVPSAEELRRIKEEARRAADEARKGMDEQRRAMEEARRAVDEQRRAADEARRAADEQRRASDAARKGAAKKTEKK